MLLSHLKNVIDDDYVCQDFVRLDLRILYKLAYVYLHIHTSFCHSLQGGKRKKIILDQIVSLLKFTM